MSFRGSAWLVAGWLALFAGRAAAQAPVDFDGSSGVSVPADADGGSIWERLKRWGHAPPPPPPQPAPAPAAPSGPVVRLVSWNLQTFGKHIQAGRRRASEKAMESVFSDPESKLLAAQEIADDDGADIVQAELPQGGGRWTRSFENSADSQDNGFFARDGARIECSAFLFPDRARSRHPARAAHVRVGELDFTIVTLHLAYDHGHADHAFQELRNVLDWLRVRGARPGADPDVIIAGDFNLPTRAGKPASRRSGDPHWQPIDDVLAEYSDLALIPLVDEATSRQDGQAANNYDHFVISRHLADTAYVAGSAARMPQASLEAIEAAEGARISDHFPISAELRVDGPGNDGRPIRPDGPGACPL
jgi:endonuclease/exonuclease/phosphatase family metal-dependent hydrolase